VSVKSLEKRVNRRSTPQQIALRTKIILLADKGKNNRDIGRELSISRFMARRWRHRWLELSERKLPVIERLQDTERCGAPAKFSMEQVVELFALACCEPEDCSRPISHWTARELAEEMVKQGRVESISPRHVGRLLEEAQIKPYSESLLVDPPLDEEFNTKVQNITNLYITAIERAVVGERTVCIDEMTGIQAIERKEKDLPLRPGKVQRREFEYIRHGTQALIANFDIVTGQVIYPTGGESRTEQDFAQNLSELLALRP
jgi:transposase